jgi:hypothetical protein
VRWITKTPATLCQRLHALNLSCEARALGWNTLPGCEMNFVILFSRKISDLNILYFEICIISSIHIQEIMESNYLHFKPYSDARSQPYVTIMRISLSSCLCISLHACNNWTATQRICKVFNTAGSYWVWQTMLTTESHENNPSLTWGKTDVSTQIQTVISYKLTGMKHELNELQWKILSCLYVSKQSLS